MHIIHICIMDQQPRQMTQQRTIQSRCDEQNQILDHTIQIIAETKEIADTTYEKLVEQTHQIEKIDVDLDDIDLHAKSAKGILNVMKTNIIKTKLLMIFIILLLIGMIALVMYTKLHHSSSSSEISPPFTNGTNHHIAFDIFSFIYLE